MKVELRITKNGTPVYTGVYDVADGDSFGEACADAWSKLRQKRLGEESSIGALFEHIDDNVLDQMNGAHISLNKA
jgi:hypothetical protein